MKEYPIKTPSHEPIFDPGNNNKTIMPPQSEPHVQESMSIKGESISKVNKRPDSEGFRNTSNLKIVFFDQQSYNAPSGMPPHEEDNV